MDHDGLLDFGKPLNRKLLIGVGVGIGVVAVIIIALAVALSAPFTPYQLPASSSGELLQLERTDATRANGDYPIVARSYDGNPWEQVADQDFAQVDISCSGTSCAVRTKGKYQVKKVEVPDYLVNASNTERWSRFLSQATFGASKTELQSTSATYQTDYIKWIRDQINIQPTLHRTYYRQRTNPRYTAALEVGNIFQPCEVGSRWHQYAFDILDEGKTVIVDNTGPNVFRLSINGILRTETPTFLNFTWPGTNNTNLTFPVNYTICDVVESIGGIVKLTPASNSTACNINLLNPAIQFSAPNAQITVQVTATTAKFTPVSGRTDALILTQISVANCTLGVTDAFLGYNGNYYRFDPRLKLLLNSLENPANVVSEAAQECPAVVKNFVNDQNCVRRASCTPLTFSSTPVVLNDANLRAWYTDSTRYVHYITGLRLEYPYDINPCSSTSSPYSRWLRLGPGPCANLTTLDNQTLTIIAGALANSTDTNPYVRDINVAGKNCTGPTPLGATVLAGGECFQHVHKDLYSVRDLSYWTNFHDGNTVALAANRPNPIARWAVQGLTYLDFPWHHPMQRWFDKQTFLTLVGRYGDTVDFRTLPTELQTLAMAERVNAISTRANEGFEICGSPGEAANDPTLGHRYQMPDLYPVDPKTRELDFRHPFNSGKSMIWTNIILKAPDQLRQRVSWALAQIFTISAVGPGRDDENEPWASYYDIFVRHAFGNYRDIMREVSYHPMMSLYLSYYQNKAYAFQNNYPDENYAREIMQLFSIGLWKLNEDGTQTLDSSGRPMATYTNDDIIDFARLWTGFDVQQPRSNIEEENGLGSPNVIDPMQLKPGWRDLLPKAKLDDGFLGDAYPLCDDLPPQHWIKEGARYVLTGASSIEGKVMDTETNTTSGFRGRFAPNPTSALYQKLCSPDGSGKCTFPSEVILTQGLACSGIECNAGRVISVKIVDKIANVTKYYTYINPPCVRLTFFDKGRVTSTSTSRQCANPNATVAGVVCCMNTSATRVIENNAAACLFANEATNYATALARCTGANYGLCNINYTGGATWLRTCADVQFQWLNATCSLQIQVYLSGQIAIVDPIVTTTAFKVLRTSSNNIFRVRWDGDNYPTAAAGCSPCKLVSTAGGDTCVCDVGVRERAVFTVTSKIPTIAEITSTLFVGAANPSSFNGVYVQAAKSADVIVWTKSGNSDWDTTTIFELPPALAGGQKRYFANFESVVYVNNTGFTFRNPPHFMPLTGEQVNSAAHNSDSQWIPKAEQEVEALLDHLFEHPSTAPFVAYRLIQRMVTSNPSPRYVRTVVKAFKTGAYEGQTFSGSYGDLGAAVAAVLLDREARTTILEADPSFGVLREPIIKILHLFRALQFQPKNGMEVILPDIDLRIGMESYNSPSVFGYYLPENRPAGPVTDHGLVSPEAQLGVPPLVVGYMNGIVSLIDNGLTSCASGFGQNYLRNNCATATLASTSDGNFSYTPAAGTPSDVIKELDLLLTNGRLNPTIRDYITQIYNKSITNTTPTGVANAFKLAQKLVISSPEFHATGANILKNKTRSKATESTSLGRPYKAIVVIFQAGGCDSFNLLVPHSNCSNKDLYDEYSTVRGLAAMPKTQLLPISVPRNSQPCDTFGIHGSMPNLKNLYDAKDALFLANIGALVEPISKADYFKQSGVTKKLPPSLFAHNIMTRSMHNLHPQNTASKGVLGRAVAALQDQASPLKSELYSLIGTVKMLEGDQEPDYIDPYNGVTKFSQYAALKQAFGNITENESEGFFSETYARLLKQSLEKTEAIAAELTATNLTATFANDYVSRQLRQVAKLIKMRSSLKTERAVFVTQRGGYDTHNTFDLNALFGDIDTALGSFAQEMKAQGIWDSVAVLTVSEFGRTLTPNGAGTDHAWSGNHFLSGGGLRGGKILGTYPSTLTDDGSLNLLRGRILPSTSWEAVWKGLAQWFGVEDSQLPYVLPNINNFPASQLFSRNELFEN